VPQSRTANRPAERVVRRTGAIQPVGARPPLLAGSAPAPRRMWTRGTRRGRAVVGTAGDQPVVASDEGAAELGVPAVFVARKSAARAGRPGARLPPAVERSCGLPGGATRLSIPWPSRASSVRHCAPDGSSMQSPAPEPIVGGSGGPGCGSARVRPLASPASRAHRVRSGLRGRRIAGSNRTGGGTARSPAICAGLLGKAITRACPPFPCAWHKKRAGQWIVSATLGGLSMRSHSPNRAIPRRESSTRTRQLPLDLRQLRPRRVPGPLLGAVER
jgi:hypothetical protein